MGANGTGAEDARMSTCKSCAREEGCTWVGNVEGVGGKGCQYHVPKNRANKFNAVKVKADRYTFDSQAEYEYWLELKDREQAGEIVMGSIRVHPFFVLYGKDLDRDYQPLARETWTADFAYLVSGEEDRGERIDDVKGRDTLLSRLKRRVAIEMLGLDVRVVWTKGRR